MTHSENSVRQTLPALQAQQRADGILLGVISAATLVPAVRFFVAPGADSAWVLGVFLFALALACRRLVNSAVQVLNSRKSSLDHDRIVQQILHSEILDVYEHPVKLDLPATQSTSPYWLPGSGHGKSSPAPGFGRSRN